MHPKAIKLALLGVQLFERIDQTLQGRYRLQTDPQVALEIYTVSAGGPDGPDEWDEAGHLAQYLLYPLAWDVMEDKWYDLLPDILIDGIFKGETHGCDRVDAL